jgi:glycosyltransferase involved in cell wall biosynthesis
MKIGLVTGEYSPQQGGLGDFTRELGRALIDLDHEVCVITTKQSGAVLDEADPIILERVIDSWGPGCWSQIGDIVRRRDLDVINVQYEPAAYGMQIGVNFLPGRWARRLVKQPIVTTFHDLLVPYLFPKAGRLRWKVVEYLARHSDQVIVTNEEDRLTLSNLQPPISSLHLIPIGSNIDPAQASDLNPATERQCWGVRADESLIGYFGFLNLSKGGEVLMRALKILVDEGLPIKLLLIGGRTGSSDPTNAEYAAQVDRLIESLGLHDRVIVTGYLESREVSRALLACEVCVLPYLDGASLRRGSLMAAIAHGRAIVTTQPALPITGLVHDESALFVPTNDPIALAQAVQQLITDRARRARLEAGAREAAQLFSWDRIAAQTLEVYRSVVA